MHNRLVLAAARELNLSVDELPYQMLRISDGKKLLYSTDFNFSFESLTAYWLCGNKHLTSSLLRERGIPVPDFAVYSAKELASAFSAFPKLRYPVVVKPCFGAGGQGITVGVTTLADFRRACYRAALAADPIIVEQMRRAAAAMGARLAGVDIIGPDATRPMASGSVFINEVNTTPDLLLNHFDVSGSGNAIATVGRLLKMVFAEAEQPLRRMAA
jgi:glutathione synthase/RimK-type ligase-like ATP-grasp enzyme